tara:strand:+ start:2123 stop:3367 length:1245 start_codon:yes stop_codon:yes gene_type:complete
MLELNKLITPKAIDKLKQKGFDFDQEKFLKLYNLKRELKQKIDDLRNQKNKIAKEMAKNFDKDLINQGKELNKEIKDNEVLFKDIETELNNFLLYIPNIPYENCPIGKNEDDNVEIKKVGQIPKFNFEIKDHVDLGFNLNQEINFEQANKIAKSRFVVLKNNIAKLHRALINFMLEEHLKNDYIEYDLPVLANKETLTGTGQLPKFNDDLFKIEGEDLFLIPTGEVPLTNLFKDEIFKDIELPIKVTANTPCFRKEAGTYGKDTRGIIRQHQFNKVELVQVVKEEEAEKALLEVLDNAENILKLLEVPYRVVELCTGDLGFAAKRTYDIEAWIPSQNKYREISSCSWFGDFQARRINIKYKEEKQKKFAHTINGSGLAIGRTIVAIIENNQTEEGFIKIPTVLKKYFNNMDYLK